MFYTIARSDGGVSIMQTIGDASPQQEIAKWSDADQASVTSIVAITADVVPVDRTFRNAWKQDGATISVDLTKARGIAQDHTRTARAPKLMTLDAEYMRADETGDVAKKAAIAARKQMLRDAPADPRLVNAVDPGALKRALSTLLSEISNV